MAIIFTIFAGGICLCVFCVLALRYYMNGGIYQRNCKHIDVKLHGKTAIITGGNSGIGKATAIDFARRGARVIISCRNPKKAEAAVSVIQRRSGSSNVVYRHLELSDQGSIRRFAEEFLKEETRLDYLINNAGIAKAMKGHRTKEGYNMVFAVNHFGHFLLTLLLLDRLKSSTPSRIINVSSHTHTLVKACDMHFALKDDQGRVYPGLREYFRSKLANILFTKELARRLDGTGVTAFCLHPGAVSSNITNATAEARGWSRFTYMTLTAMLYLIAINEESGAQTNIYCALKESITHLSGGYFINCRLAKESKVARDAGLAKKLWEVSCQAVGLDDSIH